MFNNRGFTLIEMIAVLFLIALLTALINPNIYYATLFGKKVKARSDINGLAKTAGLFYLNNDTWPARKDKNNKKHYYLLFTAINDSDEIIMEDEDGIDRSASGFLNTSDFPFLRRDNAFFHFIVNAREYAPEKDILEQRTSVSVGWQGAYVNNLVLDPWGNSYLIYVRPLWDKTAVMTGPDGNTIRQKAWIISAGPNRILETDLTEDYAPQGDDISAILK